MKKTFIAMKIEGGKVTPHDHPVFAGEVAYDLGERQEIQICEELNVREFVSESEVMQAILDYQREEKNPVEISSFYIMAKIHMNTGANVVRNNKKVTATKKK